jgi:hypothetical protein
MNIMSNEVYKIAKNVLQKRELHWSTPSCSYQMKKTIA